MTENNTNIKITEDIYNKFYSTLLVEIKKVIKNFNGKEQLKNTGKITRKNLMKIKIKPT